MNFDFGKRRGAMLAGIFSLALVTVVLLCGAGPAPLENFLPQGAMQGDLNAGGHNVTNAATVSANTLNATNVAVSGSLSLPSGFTLPYSQVSGAPATLSLTTTGSGAASYNATTGVLNVPTPGAGGVTSFNTRTGAVTLTAADVNALSGLSINGVTLAGSGTLTIGAGGTLGSAAYTATTTYDASGAAATAQAASLQKSANLSDLANPITARTNLAVPGIATANTFAQPQSAEGLQDNTGPFNVWIATIGDSKTQGYPYENLPSSLGTCSIAPSVIAQLCASGFGYNGTGFNLGIQSTGIEEGIALYSGPGNVSTTGNITAGSTSLTGLGTTTGLSNGMIVAGPGILPGTTVAISGSTATMNQAARLTTSGATINFCRPCYQSQNPTTGQTIPTAHQLSPALNTAVYTCTVTSGSPVVTLNSGTWALAQGSKITSAHFPGGTATVLGSPAPTATQVTVSTNSTGSSSVEAVTVVPFSLLLNWYGINNFEMPGSITVTATNGSATVSFSNIILMPVIGYGVSATGLAAGTTVSGINVTSYSVGQGSTGTLTLSNTYTGSTGSISLSVTPNATAFETRYAYLMSLATSDGYNVAALTVNKAWGGLWNAGDSVRAAVNTWMRATYGSETSAPAAGSSLIDIDAMPIFASNDPTIYWFGDGFGLHNTLLGEALIADHVNTILSLQYPALMSGHPFPIDRNALISGDRFGQIPNLIIGDSTTATPTYLLSFNPHLNGGNFIDGIYFGTGPQGPEYLSYNSAYTNFNLGTPSVNIAIPTGAAGVVPVVPANVGATVSGSTSGAASFTETFYGTLNKKVLISCSSLTGTASYTFPTAFTVAPVVLNTSGPAASTVTSLSTTAVTLTGSGTSGVLILEGY